MTRFAIAVLAACSACASPREPTQLERIDVALQRAGAFLVTRQHPDGAWRSRTYSALRDGWSVTPLVALSLRMAPQEPASQPAYRRGVEFLSTIAPGGVVRGAPEVSYPLHAYAIGALVLGAPDNQRHRATHAALLGALRGLQLDATRGWSASDPSFGGWGYATEAARRPDGTAGELPTANLSATVLAIGALVLGRVPVDDPALVAARGFVERCQNTDGGLVFSPSEPGANKAGLDGAKPRSYGSMTADGLRALLRLARPIDDPKVAGAIGFLERTFDPANNPGAFPASDEVRRASSYYYWAWTAAHAARHLGKRAWAEALAEEVLRRQHVDGSWRNGATEMREDDPLVATPFAIAALAMARGMLAGELRSHAY
ncbi:MAG: terpene cyclase/mutase family protein [Deltaproteobacteria bacterium]|nr:terpene cyclase/mutase family protein [Deltaproteobacteria bacterium]